MQARFHHPILIKVELGNMGDEDENIQLEMVRAAEGNVPSMITMGDINYFGARGVARDQSEALRYYEQAAAAHDPHGIVITLHFCLPCGHFPHVCTLILFL